MLFKSIQIQKEGIGKSLGELEAQIMKILWESDAPLSAREVTTQLNEYKDISFNAVSTVIKRLEAKNLVLKKAKGKRYSYTPLVERKDFAQNIVQETFQSLLNDKMLLNAAGFSGEKPSALLEKDVIESLESFIQQQKKLQG